MTIAENRSRYGARIIAVDLLEHPQGKVWNQVTWQGAEGGTFRRKTVPGSTANGQAREYVATGAVVNIVTNGRGQIIDIGLPPTEEML